MTDFKALIQDKKVALVGPAAYMVGTKLGREIDEHDVVVRINRGVELIDDHGVDIGTKTDVLYSCLIEKFANAGNINPSLLKENGVKYIVAPPHSDFKGLAHRTVFHELVDIKKVEALQKLIPIRIIDHVFHTQLAQRVSCKPNTGFLAIYDLLMLNPSQFSIYGFSFYLDGFIPGCKTGVQEEQNLTEEQFAEKCFNSKRHVQKNMWEFAKQTLLFNDMIVLDPTLRKILELDALDRSVFKK